MYIPNMKNLFTINPTKNPANAPRILGIYFIAFFCARAILISLYTFKFFLLGFARANVNGILRAYRGTTTGG